jgi:parafibromin
VVPSAATALLTLVNAKEFLEDGVFHTQAEKKSAGAKREQDQILVMHAKNKDCPTLPFLVIDNPTKLKPEEWRRVVAVFTTGAAWQFKGWKYPNPTDLFAKGELAASGSP